MKRITLFASALVFTLALAGCSKDTNGLPQEKMPSRLSLTGTAIDISAASQNNRAATKVETEALPAGLEIGAHIVDLTSGEVVNSAAIANVKHYTDPLGGIILSDIDHPMILTTGYTYDMYAYCPYDPAVASPTATAIAVAHGTDMLWAKTAGEKPNAATHTTALVFEHKTAQVKFKVVADGASKPDVTGATIKVTGFYKDGTLNLETGAIAVGTVDNTIELTELNKSVCFLPAQGQMSLKVEVNIPAGPNAGSYSGTYTKVFAAGQSDEITITVIDRNSSLTLEGGLVPWVDQTGDVDVSN